MLFCPKCGALMKPKMEKGKKVLSCSCGYTNKKAEIEPVKEVRTPKRTERFDVVSEDDTTHPVSEAHCPKCGHDEAQWWTKQMRASDEPETKFMKCTKCKHLWRDAS